LLVTGGGLDNNEGLDLSQPCAPHLLVVVANRA
jgi:hypothetical protein